MSNVRRNLLLATAPAAACGVLFAVLLHTALAPGDAPEEDGDAAPPAEGPEAGPSDGGREPVERRPRARAGRKTRIEQRILEALEDPDETKRLGAALELLRLGPARLRDMYVLEPKRPESRALLARVEGSVAVLDRIEKGNDYESLGEEQRLEIRLKYWSKVLPPDMLREERRAYWELRVASDPERVRLRAIEPGEARWHELELARVRRELGEIAPEEWKRLLDAHLGEVHAWLESLRGRREISPARVEEIAAAVGSLTP